MRVALFGGSFDPPHVGHVGVAEAARDSLGLDAVLFAPVGLQPLKPGGSSASFGDRVAMTRLAIAGRRGLSVTLLDGPGMDGGEGKPNFTYDTLLRLKAELTVEAELFLLMGADSFRDLGRWYRGAEIPFVAGLIVASRPGEELGTGEALAQWLPEGIVLEAGEGNRYVLRNGKGERSAMTVLPDLQYEVSATLLRDQMLRAGGREPSLLDARVLSYIWEHDLYCRE